MICTSSKLLIQRCHELGLIDHIKSEKFLQYISEKNVHVELYKSISLLLLPKKSHVDDSSKGAFLKAAISQVCYKVAQVSNFNIDNQSIRDGAKGVGLFAPNFEDAANSRS